MNITIDGVEFKEAGMEAFNKPTALYYKQKWYLPVDQFKKGDWVQFYSETQGKTIIGKISQWSSHSYCILEDGNEPFKHIISKPTTTQIWVHLQQIANEKGLVKGAKIHKFISDDGELEKDNFVTIVQEDNVYYPETDEFAKSGIILYRNGKWVEKLQPLFVSEDGVEMFLKDTFVAVNVGPKSGGDAYTIRGVYCQVNECTNYEEAKRNEVLWFSTKEKAQEYIDKHKLTFEILSFYYNDKLFIKNEHSKYWCKEGTWTSFAQSECTIQSIKRLSDKQIFTIGDNVVFNKIHKFKIERFYYDVSKRFLLCSHKQAVRHINITKIEKVKEPKLTFGGYDVICDLFNGTRVKIVCKGEVGWCEQISNILAHNNNLLPFGHVTTKKQTKISIGCVDGTIEELEKIHQHCLNLKK